jgi:3-dehydroquinate synthase
LASDVTLTLNYQHRVVFTRDALSPTQPALKDALAAEPAGTGRVLAVVDQHLAAARPKLASRIEAYWAHHRAHLPPLAGIHYLPGGESVKNDHAALENLLAAIADAGLCRHSYVLAIGGGAVLDVAGFAAGIAHRGVRLVRMPSTTLGQDDAGVGVKNGVNAFGKKNFLGTFAVPAAVVNDLALLDTLPDREWRCGLSEAVKVALLKEPALFERIEANAHRLAERDAAIGDEIWEASARLHVEHIAYGGDPFEETTARPLDFGHWSAHRLEALSDYELRHGEAVAIGLALDVTYAAHQGLLDADQAQRVRRCLQQLGFSLFHPALYNVQKLMQGLDEFREHLGGQLTLTQLKAIGQPINVHEMNQASINAAIETLASAQSAVAVTTQSTK